MSISQALKARAVRSFTGLDCKRGVGGGVLSPYLFLTHFGFDWLFSSELPHPPFYLSDTVRPSAL